ncbi:hypothetical protein OFO10_08235, partial [Campylobacter sp. VBCF_06 NA8]|uniref:hypothetical protein n=1 Tax=Campylobacter sp. VBCF_06 NA8 TaxID=2983822 RepID=UPI0022E9E3E9
MNKVYKLKRSSHGVKVVSEIAKGHSGEKTVREGFGSTIFSSIGKIASAPALGRLAMSLATIVAISAPFAPEGLYAEQIERGTGAHANKSQSVAIGDGSIAGAGEGAPAVGLFKGAYRDAPLVNLEVKRYTSEEMDAFGHAGATKNFYYLGYTDSSGRFIKIGGLADDTDLRDSNGNLRPDVIQAYNYDTAMESDPNPRQNWVGDNNNTVFNNIKQFIKNNKKGIFTADTGSKAFAFGVNSIAYGNNALAGMGGVAYGEDSISVGGNSVTTGDKSTAIGKNTFAKDAGTVAIGGGDRSATAWMPADKNQKMYWNGVEISKDRFGRYEIGIAGAQAIGEGSVALGSNSWADSGTGQGNVAIGYLAIAKDLSERSDNAGQSVAIGTQAKAIGSQTLAIGANTVASGYGSISIGGDDIGAHTDKDPNNPYNKYKLITDYIEVVGGPNNVSERVKLLQEAFYSDDRIEDSNPESRWMKGKGYKATEASGLSSMAIGQSSEANNTFANALGFTNTAGGIASNAIGVNNISAGNLSTTIGVENKVYDANSTAIGVINYIDERSQNAMALGNRNRMYDSNFSIAAGYYNTNKNENTITVGLENTADGNTSSAVGLKNYAHGNGAIAVGGGNIAWDANSTAFGIRNEAWVANTLAIGSENNATGLHSMALGSENNATTKNSVAAGMRNLAAGEKSASLGYENKALASESFAVGSGNIVTIDGNKSIAHGFDNTVSGKNSIAMGSGNTVKGNRSGVFGDPSNIDGDDSYAIGNNNKIKDDKTFILGNNVQITTENSVFLGDGAAYVAANANSSVITGSTAGNTNYATNYSTIGRIAANKLSFAGAKPEGVVSIGNATAPRRIQNVAAGLISAASTDAINGSQLYSVIENLPSGGSITSDNRVVRIDDDKIVSPYIHINGVGSATNVTSAQAKASNAIAIGINSEANKTSAVAIGNGSKAGGENSVALMGTKVTGNRAMAWGDAGNQATNWRSTAWGKGTEASGQQATAFGEGTKATKDNSTAWGKNTTAKQNQATAFGDGTTASNYRATAWGKDTEASGSDSTAFGTNTKATKNNATAFGSSTAANSTGATAFGANTNAGTVFTYKGEVVTPLRRVITLEDEAGKREKEVWVLLKQDGTILKEKVMFYNEGDTYKDHVAVNGEAYAYSYSALFNKNTNPNALGDGDKDANNIATYATAFGEHTIASGQDATAFGWRSAATAWNATAWGHETAATGKRATSFGTETWASGSQATAFGYRTEASNENATAWGSNSKATSTGATAWGSHTLAGGDNSTAWGKDSEVYSGEWTDPITGKKYTDISIQFELRTGDNPDGDTYKVPVLDEEGNQKLDENNEPIFEEKIVQVQLGTYWVQGRNEAGELVEIERKDEWEWVYSGEFDQDHREDVKRWIRKNGNTAGDYSTAFGDSSKVYAENALGALGGIVEIDGINSAAIGKGATVSVADTIALGSGSVANRDNLGENNATWLAQTYKGYDVQTKTAGDKNLKMPDNAVWIGTRNAISVGDFDNNITRQITGVAAGWHDTDAVNVAQLKRAVSGAGTIWSVGIDKNGTGTNKDGTLTFGKHTVGTEDYNKTGLDFIAGDNVDISYVELSKDNNETSSAYGIKFSAKDTNVTSKNGTVIIATTRSDDNMTTNYDLKVPVKLGGDNNDTITLVSYNKAGEPIYDKNVTLTNVAPGVDDTDAVNVWQLKKGVEGNKTKVTVNGGTVAPTDGTYTDGNLKLTHGGEDNNTYDLKLANNLVIGNDGKDG